MIYFLCGLGAGILIMTGLWGWFIGRHKRKKIDNLTKYVIFSISFAILYTIMEFIFSILTGVSHDILSGCVYGFFCGELVITGILKIFKLRGEDNNE
jgi:hypothetical protein